jgi:hypothetical protein
MAGGARGRWDIFLHPSALRLGIANATELAANHWRRH